MFPRLPAPAKFVAGTNLCVRNILCPQQMFPSLPGPRNIMGNNVSATMCPHLLGPIEMVQAGVIVGEISTFQREKCLAML